MNQYINAYVYIYYNIFLFINIVNYTVDSKDIAVLIYFTRIKMGFAGDSRIFFGYELVSTNLLKYS